MGDVDIVWRMWLVSPLSSLHGLHEWSPYQKIQNPIHKLERFNQEMLPAQRWEQRISESIAESIRKK
jgi:hypothetical protein